MNRSKSLFSLAHGLDAIQGKAVNGRQLGRRQSMLASIRRVAAISIAFAGGLMAEYSFAQLDYDMDFESSDMFYSVIRCSGNCPTITTQYSREGRSAMRSYLNRKTSDISYRTEMTFRGGTTGEQKMEFGRDYWIGFSTMLPGDWTHLNTGGEMLAQIHGTMNKATGVSGVPFEIRPKNGDWRIITRGENETKKLYTLNSVYEDVGRWVDWVIHYRPSYNSNGTIRVWKDGALVVNQMDRRTAFISDIGPYWKMGLYLEWKDRNCCDDDPVDRLVYHDALRITSGPQAGYLDVAPRGGSIFVQDSASTGLEPEPAPESEPVPEPDSGLTAPTQEPVIESTSNTVGGSTEAYVDIVNLADGDSVRGQVDVVIDAQDPDGIRYVAFWIGGERVGKLSSPPYNFVFDSRPYAGTSNLRLKAYAHDNTGNMMRTVTRVNVSLPEPERVPEPDSGLTAPTQEPVIESTSNTVGGSTEAYVDIVNLADGDSVRGQVDVVIDAQDPDGIRYVAFWVGDERIGKLSSPPYNFVFDSRPYAGTGSIRLKAYVHDNTGNMMRTVTRVKVSR